MKKFKLIILIFSILMFTGCYSVETIPNYNAPGYKEQVKAQRRIDKEKRQTKRAHNKRRRQIERLQ